MVQGQFLKSAVLPKDFPPPDRPEIVLVGRSNAGKSSFLNALCNNRKLAKVSRTPGKTRTLNFFDIGQHYRIVDMPGYGFANRPRSEREMWDQMISQFFAERGNLIGILLICDVRRDWQKEEQQIFDLAKTNQLEFLCILSKADKLGRNDLQKQIRGWVKSSNLEANTFKTVSSLNRTGVDELEREIYESWVCNSNASPL